MEDSKEIQVKNPFSEGVLKEPEWDMINQSLKDLQFKECFYYVDDEVSAKTALSMALQSRKLANTLEKSRVEITKPHVDYQRAINKIIKDYQAGLEKIEDNLRVKINAWLSTTDKPYQNVKSLKVEDGSLYHEESWDYLIQVPEEIPREYLIVDDAKIKKEIKNGVRNIPGLGIIHTSEIKMRVKN